MNPIKLITVFFLLFASILFTSCENEPIDSALLDSINNGGGGGSGGGTTSGEFKLDFDGKTLVANSVQAIVNDSYIAITGIKTSTGEIIQITLSAPNNKVGTYTLKNTTDGTLGLAYIPSNGSEPLLAVSDDTIDLPQYTDTATLTITKLDLVNNKISGTFQFTGMKFVGLSGTEIQTKKFTNGSFTNISFKNDLPIVNTKNTFDVKMNGVNFEPTYINGISSQGKINIVARKGNVENIGFTLVSSITPGTYDISSFVSDNQAVYNRNNNPDGSGIFGADGTLIITNHDKSKKIIVGTFDLVAGSFFSTEKVNFTRGSFTIYY